MNAPSSFQISAFLVTFFLSLGVMLVRHDEQATSISLQDTTHAEWWGRFGVVRTITHEYKDGRPHSVTSVLSIEGILWTGVIAFLFGLAPVSVFGGPDLNATPSFRQASSQGSEGLGFGDCLLAVVFFGGAALAYSILFGEMTVTDVVWKGDIPLNQTYRGWEGLWFTVRCETDVRAEWASP